MQTGMSFKWTISMQTVLWGHEHHWWERGTVLLGATRALFACLHFCWGLCKGGEKTRCYERSTHFSFAFTFPVCVNRFLLQTCVTSRLQNFSDHLKALGPVKYIRSTRILMFLWVSLNHWLIGVDELIPKLLALSEATLKTFVCTLPKLPVGW